MAPLGNARPTSRQLHPRLLTRSLPTAASVGTDATPQLSNRPENKHLAKEELLTIEGIIDEVLPDGRFGVMLDNEHRIIAYTAGKMRRFRIRSIVGDRVHVEMTPYDLSKGRIIFREKLPGQQVAARRHGFRR
jgi:translation initiation factor IF-1